MPRRKLPASGEEPAEEPRVTRRSLRARTVTPKKEEEKTTSPTKSPGRGKTKGRGKKTDEDEVEPAGEPEPVSPKKKKGKGRGSASPRGRQTKKADSEAEDSATEETGETSPTKSNRRRSRGAKTAEESLSPRRKSSRGAAKAASEAIGKQASGDQDEGVEMDEEEGDSSRGTKRKADEKEEEESAEASEEKRQKVEEAAETTEEKPVQTEASKDDEKEETISAQDKSTKEASAAESQQAPTDETAEVSVDAAESEEAMDADGALEESYVHVSPEDVPLHDSFQVQQSLPRVNNHINQSINTNAPVGGHLPNSSNLSNDTSPIDLNDDPLFTRRFVMNPGIDHSTISPNRVFTVASYNILAECHAVRGIKEWNQYTFTTEEKLYHNYRHTRFWKELEHLDADIYCLQEVPPKYFEQVLVPAFGTKGYKGEYIKRADPDMDEGEATFYNSKRFTALRCQGYVLHDLSEKVMDQVGVSEEKKSILMRAATNPGVFMLAQLQCNQTGCTLNIANIHVSWEFMKRPDVQCLQIASAIKELVSQAGGADKPHIICGDFNSTPTSAGHELARDGYLSDANVTLLQDMNNIDMPDGQKTSMINLFWSGFQHTSNVLKSAYNTAQGCNPISSCFPHDSSCLAVDYIWYSDGALKLAGVLEAADRKLIEKGIPNDVFPSDHLSIKAKLAFA